MDTERLASQARVVAERARLRFAWRVAPVPVSLATIAAMAGSDLRLCLIGAAATTTASVWLRWRDRAGVDAADTALRVGTAAGAVGVTLSCLRDLQAVSQGVAPWVCGFACVGVSAFAWWSQAVGSRASGPIAAILAAIGAGSLGWEASVIAGAVVGLGLGVR